MLRQPPWLLLWIVLGTGILLGFGALFALLIPSRLSKRLGQISVGCVITPLLVASAIGGRVPPLQAFFIFGLFCVPGFLGIAFNGSLHDMKPPGHCKACGYNLTGNVSGKCSECGAPVVAP